MKTLKALILSGLLCISFPLMSQETSSSPMHYDIVSGGLGMGLDYGGFGGNLLYYPQTNIGLFGGVGYAMAGMGFNVGTKLRLVSTKKFTKLAPSFIAMYGYNAVVYISDATGFNKFFYGPTFGLGLDFLSNPDKRGYFSLALLIPIRSQEVYDYINMLESDYGAEFSSPMMPVAISLGYRFIFN